jgi:hypothetical protein
LCDTNQQSDRTAGHSNSSSSLSTDNLLSLFIFNSECRNQQPTPPQTNPLSLFFTAPTQATGLGNFTDYRIHTTNTLTTTTKTPSMAEEQATEPMGDLGRGPEQDEAMGGPVGGPMVEVPEETLRSAVPPLRIDTSMFRGGYRGMTWGKGNPSAAPLRDSKKSHVAKPDPFKE